MYAGKATSRPQKDTMKLSGDTATPSTSAVAGKSTSGRDQCDLRVEPVHTPEMFIAFSRVALSDETQ